jgi:hypothetical protein
MLANAANLLPAPAEGYIRRDWHLARVRMRSYGLFVPERL